MIIYNSYTFFSLIIEVTHLHQDLQIAKYIENYCKYFIRNQLKLILNMRLFVSYNSNFIVHAQVAEPLIYPFFQNLCLQLFYKFARFPSRLHQYAKYNKTKNK